MDLHGVAKSGVKIEMVIVALDLSLRETGAALVTADGIGFEELKRILAAGPRGKRTG